MEEKLNNIFININDWLKYSEAKNGILFALNGGVIMGVVSLLGDSSFKVPIIINLVAVPCFLVSLVVLLISFLPVVNKLIINTEQNETKNQDDINLFFYGDLRKLNAEALLTKLYNSVDLDIEGNISKLQQNLADQIITNSSITYNKLMFFRIALYLDLIGIIICSIAFFSAIV